MLVNKISITECAKQLELTRPTIYSYIKKGLITPRKTPGGKTFFLQEDVDELKNKLMYGVEDVRVQLS